MSLAATWSQLGVAAATFRNPFGGFNQWDGCVFAVVFHTLQLVLCGAAAGCACAGGSSSPCPFEIFIVLFFGFFFFLLVLLECVGARSAALGENHFEAQKGWREGKGFA